jgi:hypothetical protein
VRIFEGSKTLKGKAPRMLASEKRCRGFGRRKPLRGYPNPESGTDGVRQAPEKWTFESGMRCRGKKA